MTILMFFLLTILMLCLFVMVVLTLVPYQLWAAKIYAKYIDSQIWRQYEAVMNADKILVTTSRQYYDMFSKGTLDPNAIYHYMSTFWYPHNSSNRGDYRSLSGRLILTDGDITHQMYKDACMKKIGYVPIDETEKDS